MPTYRLTIEYEGTRYSGWQSQGNTPKTVQGKLLRAIEELFGEADLGGAGRTDAGVHASGQVAHLRLRQAVPLDQMREKINDLLPADIHVLTVERATISVRPGLITSAAARISLPSAGLVRLILNSTVSTEAPSGIRV